MVLKITTIVSPAEIEFTDSQGQRILITESEDTVDDVDLLMFNRDGERTGGVVMAKTDLFKFIGAIEAVIAYDFREVRSLEDEE